MNGQSLFYGSPLHGNFPRVLVVDDIPSSSDFTVGLLKMMEFQVTSTQDSIEALTIIRKNEGSFDLVISNVYMPLFNGIKLRKRIEEEFNIPVILISNDEDKRKLIEEIGLEEGTFVMAKPPLLTEFDNLWHFVLARINAKNKKKKTSQHSKSNDDKNNQKRKSPIEHEEGEVASKKAKLVWTTALHCKFLDAVKEIGFERTVPSRILRHMNEPQLTRDNIASHLQKYRICLSQMYNASIETKDDIMRGGIIDKNKLLLKNAISIFMGQQLQPKRAESKKKVGKQSKKDVASSVVNENKSTNNDFGATSTQAQSAAGLSTRNFGGFFYGSGSSSSVVPPYVMARSKTLTQQPQYPVHSARGFGGGLSNGVAQPQFSPLQVTRFNNGFIGGLSNGVTRVVNTMNNNSIGVGNNMASNLMDRSFGVVDANSQMNVRSNFMDHRHDIGSNNMSNFAAHQNTTPMKTTYNFGANLQSKDHSNDLGAFLNANNARSAE